ncbi:hypothetical protein H072_305 [Dactylellina haptotyla CBS 200.50]|uniref:Uncharacterized protein n=1 Tax=Dactylellina haptotyla (strain CBS 200.50) TaxID=1284197 RepID=S8AS13_DACHA|nr:hypothetical protein H072_305 [Dactylellina haptotyla CBS 200.50]
MLFFTCFGALVWSLFVSLILTNISHIFCYALSEKFYKDYVEAQAQLRGGSIYAWDPIRERQLVPVLPRCTAEHEGSDSPWLCRLEYTAAKVPNTLPEATNPEQLAQDETIPTWWTVQVSASTSVVTLTVTITETSTRIARSPQISEYQQSSAFMSSPRNFVDTNKAGDLMTRDIRDIKGLTRSDQTYINREDFRPSELDPGVSQAHGSLYYNTKTFMEMIFQHSANVDSVMASATLSLSYDPFYKVLFITANETGSINTWTTSTSMNVVNISPFPLGPMHVKNWVIRGYSGAVDEFESICHNVHLFKLSETARSVVTDGFPVTTGFAQNINAEGTFYGYAGYDSATAAWNAIWGPYDEGRRCLPVSINFTGIDGSHSYQITEAWTLLQPFSGTNEADVLKKIAVDGLEMIASRLSSWNYAQRWPTPTDELGIRATQNEADTGATSTRPMPRQVTTVIAAVTETVRVTATHTNTLIPKSLFGRTTNIFASTERGLARSRNRILLGFLVVLGTVLSALCIIRFIMWYHENFHTNEQQSDPIPRPIPRSTKFNIFRRAKVRKASGSQIVDSTSLLSTRNRANKSSFETIELND